MMTHFRIRIQFQNHKNPLTRIMNPPQFPNTNPKFPQTLKMVNNPPNSRRPICPSCSKPTHFCLCSRLQNPRLENSIGIIILQHSLEKKHPLNSARIARLGLKNVKIFTVSDVNFEAHFTIQLQKPNPSEECSFRNNNNSAFQETQNPSSSILKTGFMELRERADVITATIGKYGAVLNNFDEILTSPEIHAILDKGFIVRKWQKRKLNGRDEFEEFEEFEIEVPPKSVLLFPSESAISVDDGIDFDFDFDVDNLIVLDGTWAKAKRIYNENPWLKFLPHLKLDLDKMSLYSEVRHQPKIGFLSTIESIVYAMKVIGDNPQGLDTLLDVFQSMIEDQRRCKDERIKSTIC